MQYWAQSRCQDQKNDLVRTSRNLGKIIFANAAIEVHIRFVRQNPIGSGSGRWQGQDHVRITVCLEPMTELKYFGAGVVLLGSSCTVAS